MTIIALHCLYGIDAWYTKPSNSLFTTRKSLTEVLVEIVVLTNEHQHHPICLLCLALLSGFRSLPGSSYQQPVLGSEVQPRKKVSWSHHVWIQWIPVSNSKTEQHTKQKQSQDSIHLANILIFHQILRQSHFMVKQKPESIARVTASDRCWAWLSYTHSQCQKRFTRDQRSIAVNIPDVSRAATSEIGLNTESAPG